MLSGPADAAQQEPRNEGGATGRCNGAVQRGPRNSGNPTEAPHENDTTDRTVCTVRFFAPFCGMAQKFRTAHAANSDGFFNFAYRYPNTRIESNQNDIPVL